MMEQLHVSACIGHIQVVLGNLKTSYMHARARGVEICTPRASASS